MRARRLIPQCFGVLLLCSAAYVAAQGIDQSILPDIYRTPWDPGIPGGIPADDDPVRPASVWLPAGDPYGGYSVNPALTGTANAAAFSSAFQAAINAAGAAATPTISPSTSAPTLAIARCDRHSIDRPAAIRM